MNAHIVLAPLLLIFAAGCSTKSPQPDEPTGPEPLGCDISEPETCDVEGMRWENAVGRSRNRNEAARHYEAACDNGVPAGCAHLGALYFEADEIDRARSLYEKACEAQNPEGCGNLAFVLSRDGEVDRARQMYQQACDDGAMFACANLADMHQSGRGVDVDHDTAAKLFQKACYGGNASACIRWSWSRAQQCNGDACADKATDEEGAAARTETYCQAERDDVVCTGYGVHLESGQLLRKDAKRARELYAHGCERGEAWACERLGTAHLRGLGGPRDPAAAPPAYDKACEAGFAPACSGLGALYLGGEGVDRDEQRGAELVRRACEMNERRACNTLLLLGL